MQTKEIRNKKAYLIISGLLLLTVGIIIILFDYYKATINQKDERISIEQFYIEEDNIVTDKILDKPYINKDKYNYGAVIKIPKINLEKGIVSKNSKYNNVKYGIEVLKESDSPDVINGNVILASHSGTSSVSYFKNLYKLTVNDEIIINYKRKIYNYKIVDIYDIDKTGKALIKRNNNISTLTLITCRGNTNKQIVIISELQK